MANELIREQDPNDKTDEEAVPIPHKDAYLNAGGSFCPFCKRDDAIIGDSVEILTGSAFQHVHCSACGATWCDVYTLTDVETVHPPKPRPRGET